MFCMLAVTCQHELRQQITVCRAYCYSVLCRFIKRAFDVLLLTIVSTDIISIHYDDTIQLIYSHFQPIQHMTNTISFTLTISFYSNRHTSFKSIILTFPRPYCHFISFCNGINLWLGLFILCLATGCSLRLTHTTYWATHFAPPDSSSIFSKLNTSTTPCFWILTN